MSETLRDYQVADLAFLIANPKGGLLHEPGGGKTPPVCVYLWYRWNTLGTRAIWAMPKQLMRKNRKELLRFTHFKPEDVVILDGNPAQIAEIINGNAKVFLMGGDRLRLSGKALVSKHPDIKCIVGDETHMMWSTNGSARVGALYDLMRKMDSFVPMTGTLIKGRLSSAFPVFHCIEPRYYPSYQTFLNYHAIFDCFDNVIGWRNPERIAEIVGKHFISRSFESIYGKESKIIQTEVCDMGSKQRAEYDEFEARAIIELENSFLTGATGGVHALRCRQIMAHPETFGLSKGEPTGKDLLLDLHLENHLTSGKPLVIYAAFLAEQNRILAQVKAKGMTGALMNGTVSTTDRAMIDERFCAGTLQVIVGSPQVATVGYNWGHCDHCVFTTLDPGDDVFYQSYRRFIRGKRTSPLLITVLEYENSLDQRTMRNIKKKSKLANAVDSDREIFDLSGVTT